LALRAGKLSQLKIIQKLKITVSFIIDESLWFKKWNTINVPDGFAIVIFVKNLMKNVFKTLKSVKMFIKAA